MALSTIREELAAVRENGITEQELADAKQHLEGKMMLQMEDSSELAEWIGKQEIYLNKVVMPEERLEEYRAVTREQVQQAAVDVLNDAHVAFAAIGPYKDKEAFLSAAKWTA